MKSIIILTFALLTQVVFAESLPDFSLSKLKSDRLFKLSEDAWGKRVVINFWATWCTSCIKEIAILENLKEKYKSDTIFIAVNAGEKERLIENFIKKHKFTYEVLLDTDRTFSKSIGVNALPITIVIDRDRNIIYREVAPPEKL